MAEISEDVYARQIHAAGLATPEQIAAARKLQHAVEHNPPVSLGDALVRMSVITSAQRETLERRIVSQNGAPKTLGHFKLLKKLGEGGMGKVYLAEDELAGRQVALKVLSPTYAKDADFLARFHREAKAAGKLNHPNIVSAYSVHQDSGVHYYAMEYCTGESLGARLKREGSLPWKTVLEIAIQVTEGLKYAHDQDIIHRDIKPDNIFLMAGEPFTVKILDLGLSKDISGAENAFSTQALVAMGTPHYISPEQANGSKNIDGRADQYSLGATMFHLLTGKTPFDGDAPHAIIVKHLTQPVPNLRDIRPDVPDLVSQFVRKLMAKSPDNRYPTCADLLFDLERVKRNKPLSNPVMDALPVPVAAQERRGTSRHGKIKSSQHFPVVSRDTPDPRRGERGERAREKENQSKPSPIMMQAVIGGAVGIALLLLLIFAFKGKPAKESAKVEPPKPIPASSETAIVLAGDPPKPLAYSNDPVNRPPPTPPPVLESPRPRPTEPPVQAAQGMDTGPSNFDEWMKWVQAAPPETQVKRVIDKIKSFNPRYENKNEKHVIENGEVAELNIRVDQVTDISPLRALPHLQRLNCSGPDHSWTVKATLTDLSPLKELKLTWLRMCFVSVKDLSPLKDMPLQSINLWGTEVDLTPLKDIKTLRELECQYKASRDAANLKAMPFLTRINQKTVSDFWATNPDK